ncbi:hypothetical protein FZI93_00375 [Mycobacterium sp. CBMA361]|nr:hypothetical protein [Mycolicibacterium sp. CBMA 361]
MSASVSGPHLTPWLLERAEFLVHDLQDRHELTVCLEAAAEDIVSWRNQIAERLRIQQKSANRYITDEALTRLSDHIAQCLDDAQCPPAPVIHLAGRRQYQEG